MSVVAHGIRTLGVLGSGQMGVWTCNGFLGTLLTRSCGLRSGLGIAYVAALRAKVPVLLHDRSSAQINKGLALMDKLLEKDVAKACLGSDRDGRVADHVATKHRARSRQRRPRKPESVSLLCLQKKGSQGSGTSTWSSRYASHSRCHPERVNRQINRQYQSLYRSNKLSLVTSPLRCLQQPSSRPTRRLSALPRLLHRLSPKASHLLARRDYRAQTG